MLVVSRTRTEGLSSSSSSSGSGSAPLPTAAVPSGGKALALLFSFLTFLFLLFLDAGPERGGGEGGEPKCAPDIGKAILLFADAAGIAADENLRPGRLAGAGTMLELQRRMMLLMMMMRSFFRTGVPDMDPGDGFSQTPP